MPVRARLLSLLWLSLAVAACGQIPPGFTPLFNGKDLSGWHISQTNHHGNTQAWSIHNGVVSVTQDRPGNGGILLTDNKYKNFELYLEINPDYGCDGGIFLRSSEKGEAYQVMLDYLDGGNMGGIYGEGLPAVNQPGNGTGKRMERDWQRYWKLGDWNQLRIRIEGDIPHIQVWMNGNQIVDWTDSANHAAGGATDGMIALQAHFSNERTPRWVQGGYHRYRNVAIKVLP